MAIQSELFPSLDRQASLFGESDDRIPHPKAEPYRADPEKIRRKLHVLLDKARSATIMPWSARDAAMYQTIFPNMANWLPTAEADQLRFEFAQEIERLKLAA
jgi:hypothetical protein